MRRLFASVGFCVSRGRCNMLVFYFSTDRHGRRWGTAKQPRGGFLYADTKPTFRRSGINKQANRCSLKRKAEAQRGDLRRRLNFRLIATISAIGKTPITGNCSNTYGN